MKVKNLKLQKKTIIRILVGLLLIGVVALMVIWMGAPHKGRVTLASSPHNEISSTRTDKTLHGTYMTFNYSGMYLAKSETDKNNDLEVHTLVADSNYDKRIVASVSNLPDGQLNSYGAYKMRSVRTDLYTARKIQLGDGVVDLWVRHDNTEQTAFILRGNKVVTISFVTSSTSGNLTPEVEAILRSFRWK